MGSIEILGDLYLKPDMKIDQYDTEKCYIAFWSNLFKRLHVMTFISV